MDGRTHQRTSAHGYVVFGVVQLDLRLAVFSPSHPAITHGDVVPGFKTGYAGFKVCEVKH